MTGLGLSLHVGQLPIFFSKARVKVLCAGRGFGKTLLLLFTAIIFCLTYKDLILPESPQVALIAMPTLKMARSVHWIPILNLLEKVWFVDKVDKSDFRVSFKGELPDLILRGSDRQGARLRGLNLAFAGLDEYQDFDATVWDEVIEPALARNRNYKALVIGTPSGKASHFYKFHLNAIRFKGWRYFHRTTLDNPFISREAIAKAEAELPPKVFRQEYLAAWEDFEGQLFPNIGEHHKAIALPEQFRSVAIGGDWGEINPFLIVLGVSHAGDYYMLDKFKPGGTMPITEDELKVKTAELERKYNVYRCYLPDDRPASILAFRRYGKQHGLPGMQRTVQVVRSKPGPVERALIGDSLFYQNRLFFGPNCHDLYDDFESYHRATDSQGQLTTEIAKGQSDHGIDSLLYIIGQLEGRYVQPVEAAWNVQ